MKNRKGIMFIDVLLIALIMVVLIAIFIPKINKLNSDRNKSLCTDVLAAPKNAQDSIKVYKKYSYCLNYITDTLIIK